jgi:kynurenine formamidase
MKVIDLSHFIDSKMAVYPGTEQPIIKKANTLETEGFREAKLTMYSHTGTHIDAPGHIIEDGPFLDALEIEHFIGKGIMLDFSDSTKEHIDMTDLKPYAESIKDSEFLILKTGWSHYWEDEKYFENFPTLTETGASWLSQFHLKGIGVDAISIDAITSIELPIHKILLSKNIIIIENLTNLEAIINQPFTLSVMPLKTRDADGSPVRAMAIISV